MTVTMKHSSQAGFVSILTVLLFMVLTSIVTVSFIRVVTMEQRQSLNNDMSKGAYDAAQSGVQDAKRAIRYCLQTGCDTPTQLYNQSCPGFFGDAGIRTALGLQQTDEAVRVGDPSANERYTCVTVSNEAKELVGELDPQSPSRQTMFIPLDSNSTFNRVKVSWAMKKETRPLTVPSFTAVDDYNPRTIGANGTAWDPTWPAALRTMFVYHPDGFTLDSVQSRSSYWFPATNSADGNPQSQNSLLPKRLVQCNPSVSSGDYACSLTVTGLSNSGNWYLQLAPEYAPTDYKVELFSGSSRVPMSNFGFVVDATGAVGDVYRRVQVTLGPGDVVSPSAAIQTGGQLCKNFSVSGSFGSDMPHREDCDL